jgi:hypothetical protein
MVPAVHRSTALDGIKKCALLDINLKKLEYLLREMGQHIRKIL